MAKINLKNVEDMTTYMMQFFLRDLETAKKLKELYNTTMYDDDILSSVYFLREATIRKSNKVLKYMKQNNTL